MRCHRAHIARRACLQDLLCQRTCTRSDRPQRSERCLSHYSHQHPAPGGRNMAQLGASTRKLCSWPGTCDPSYPLHCAKVAAMAIVAPMRKLTPLLCKMPGFPASERKQQNRLRPRYCSWFDRRQQQPRRAHALSTWRRRQTSASDRAVRPGRGCLPRLQDQG